MSGAVAGALRAASCEYSELHLRQLDFDTSALNSVDFKQVYAHILTDSNWQTLNIKGSAFYQAAVVPVQLQEEQAQQEVQQKAQQQSSTGSKISSSALQTGSVIITGGLGSIGLLTAAVLPKLGVRHIILTGRQAPDAAKVAEIKQRIAGQAKVHFIKADISRASEAEKLVEATAKIAPPIGLIHAAGVLADQSLLNLDEAKLEQVLAPKVSGIQHLTQALEKFNLSFFVYYSSLAAHFGFAGQFAYASANAYMDAWAEQQSKKGNGLWVWLGGLGQVVAWPPNTK
ncbi:MAG: SDR family NAD(P)-dependent oxidoreductase [Limnobacter sp.]|nr:SDR family NAD(P)-dependent oxidoreductase [Limnobacter sp.]